MSSQSTEGRDRDDQKHQISPSIKVDNHSKIDKCIVNVHVTTVHNTFHAIECSHRSSSSTGTQTPTSAMQPPRGVRVQSDPLGPQFPLPSSPDMSRSQSANTSQSIGSSSSSVSSSGQPRHESRPLVRFPSIAPPRLRVIPRQAGDISPMIMEPLESESIDPSTMGRSSPQPPEYSRNPTPPPYIRSEEPIPMVYLKPLPPFPGMDPAKHPKSVTRIQLPAWGPGSLQSMSIDQALSLYMPDFIDVLKAV
jgi:type IV secretory pathway VirB10-like protein